MVLDYLTTSISRLFKIKTKMRCLSCNCSLSDREANRKYENWLEIPKPEDQYIMLCDDCILDTDLAFVEDPTLSSDTHDTDKLFEHGEEEQYE